MVPRKQGLIVFISSFGSMKYLFNVPYGIGKCAVDRMAVDCGVELKKSNVASLSLMVGPVRTELITKLHDLNKESGSDRKVLMRFFWWRIWGFY
jgi:dehydrogenase/reductase SDR family protein 1